MTLFSRRSHHEHLKFRKCLQHHNQITTGAPQAGLRCDPSAVVRSAGKSVAPGMDISGLGTLKNIDEAARQGYREDYSIRDAADALWRKETQTFNLKDLDDPEKSKE